MHNIKTIVILVILIAVVICGWLWYSASNTSAPAPAADASDATLQSDLDAIGSQMDGLDADTAAVDASLNAQ